MDGAELRDKPIVRGLAVGFSDSLQTLPSKSPRGPKEIIHTWHHAGLYEPHSVSDYPNCSTIIPAHLFYHVQPFSTSPPSKHTLRRHKRPGYLPPLSSRLSPPRSLQAENEKGRAELAESIAKSRASAGPRWSEGVLWVVSTPAPLHPSLGVVASAFLHGNT